MSKAFSVDFKKGYKKYKENNPNKRMNNQVIAEMLGCSAQTITNLKTKTPLNIEILFKASRILGVPVTDFVVKNKQDE